MLLYFKPYHSFQISNKLKTLLILSTILHHITSFSQTNPSNFPINFSHAGYAGGGVTIPNIPTIISIKPTGADDTKLLQAAINHLSTFPVQKNGYKGALLLQPGKYKVSGKLLINKGGIVIRGSGQKNTTIIATKVSRRSLITIGKNSKLNADSTITITADLAAGKNKLTVTSVTNLSVGNHVVITRPSTKEWIASLGMDTLKGAFAELRIHWKPGSRNIYWHRTITAINPTSNEISIDAPITVSIEKKFGRGIVAKQPIAPIRNIGIEELSIQSDFDQKNLKDEEHAWIGIQVEHAQDVFIRNTTARHFVSSAFRVGPQARRVTIENCKVEKPIAELGGYRRNNFYIEGQQVLVYNCSSQEGMSDFAVGFCAAGPNVFLNCSAINSHQASGTLESFASGILYENVKIDKAPLFLTYNISRTQAAGWTAANSVVWNCVASDIKAAGPAGFENVVINSPTSLYENQLKERTGKTLASLINPTAVTTTKPRLFKLTDIPSSKQTTLNKNETLQIINGRFVIGNKVIWGGSVNDAWWMGQATPEGGLDAGISVTRFVPGKTGSGLTEDLPSLAQRIKNQRTPFFQNGPGLWYDRRRDDHTVDARNDANVWAPFYEMPWQRTGQGTSWEGLSKFDVSKYNPWYFNRIKEFAALSEQHQIVLYHNLYNTHNLLEIGAHWADYPWRPANSINTTALPEPPPVEPNNRLHLGNQFYNTNHPNQKALHKAFINHVFNEVGSFKNVIFNVGFQFAGPLAFQNFFIETAAQWQQNNKKTLRLSMATSKDITDSILSNPTLAKHVAIVDMRYWQYRPDGTLFAPLGGQNLAFREIITMAFKRSSDAPPATTPYQAYRQVREYCDKYPSKAIISWHNGVGPIPALMGGAAQVLMQNPTAGHGQGRSVDRNTFDGFVDNYLSKVLYKMTPKDGILADKLNNWMLTDKNELNILVYSVSGQTITFIKDIKQQNYKANWYNPKTGKTESAKKAFKIKAGDTISKPSAEEWLLYLVAQ
ncbi:MAG: hypothetical protein JWQ96_3007 [Segetibacter sp.]|nr:hypothetical protein [Segetibacter sp.]